MITRRKPLKRRVRPKPVNPSRRARLRERNYGERAEAVRRMACLVGVDQPHWEEGAPACRGHVVAAHARSRGAGGDRRSLVPLCWWHHGKQHEMGLRTFERCYRLDLRAEAERIAVELDARGLP